MTGLSGGFFEGLRHTQVVYGSYEELGFRVWRAGFGCD